MSSGAYESGWFDLNRNDFAHLGNPLNEVSPALYRPQLNFDHTALGKALSASAELADKLDELMRRVAEWFRKIIDETIGIERLNAAIEAFAKLSLGSVATPTGYVLPRAAIEAPAHPLVAPTYEPEPAFEPAESLSEPESLGESESLAVEVIWAPTRSAFVVVYRFVDEHGKVIGIAVNIIGLVTYTLLAILL